MNILKTLYDALSPVVDGRVETMEAPFDTPRPYITYQLFGGLPLRNSEGGPLSVVTRELQINVWADTAGQAEQTIAAAEAALVAAIGSVEVLSEPVWDHDSDLERYGARQDFSITLAR